MLGSCVTRRGWQEDDQVVLARNAQKHRRDVGVERDDGEARSWHDERQSVFDRAEHRTQLGTRKWKWRLVDLARCRMADPLDVPGRGGGKKV